jgi:hypothetical protein
MKNEIILVSCGAIFALLSATPAHADHMSGAADLPTTSTPATPDGDTPPPRRIDPLDEAQPLSDLDLSGYRGGESLVVGNQTLKAITANNAFTGDYVAGAVTFSDGAFSNFNGVGNFAINTGAQVSLQSGMSLVINVAQ